MKFWNRHAFTLMELMIVVIALSVMAAFAIPNYQKSMDKAYEKQILQNMQAIAAAQEVYKARYGYYWPYPTAGNVGMAGGLNTALQLNIVPGNDVYGCCMNSAGAGYVCYGAHQAGGFKWQLTNYENYNGPPVRSLSTNQGIHNNGACCDSYYLSNSCPTIQFDGVATGTEATAACR